MINVITTKWNNVMRSIKFRVWDETNKKWGNPEQLEGDKDGNISYFDMDFGSHICAEKVTIQQYTGCNDKNNKEIYEGDIVNYKFKNGSEDDFTTYRDVVKFKNGSFDPVCIKEECEDSWYSYELFDIEVVGNIFDNPSLV